MATIISIETSTAVCSVALHQNGQLRALREDERQHSHAANITIFIHEVLKDAGVAISQTDAVAVSKGPGSYTGLRIGVSAAKGLCYALQKPLIAINTLESMAHSSLLTETAHSLLCPMIDARRMEVYCALFNENRQWVEKTHARIIDEDSFAPYLKKQKILFFGDGADKCKPVLTHPNAVFIDNIRSSATYTGMLAYQKYQQQQFEDVAYFEPFYLKEFVGTVAKK